MSEASCVGLARELSTVEGVIDEQENPCGR